MSERERTLSIIARGESRLASLQAEEAQLRAHLDALRSQLDAPERSLFETLEQGSTVRLPETPGEKVSLFKRLFRGRTDVFPRHWENPPDR